METASSGFSFLNTDTGDTSSSNTEPSSGFSFLSNPVETTNEGVADGAAVSGFSFLSNPAETTNEVGMSGSSTTSSSFSFLANPVESVEASTEGTSVSAFSFLTAPSVSNNTTGNDSSMLGPTVVTNEEIKLGKVASNKVVKKKKRTGKVVGFARDEEDEVEEKVETYPQEISVPVASYETTQQYLHAPVATAVESKGDTIPAVSAPSNYSTNTPSVNVPPPPLNPPPPIPVVYSTPPVAVEVLVVPPKQSNDDYTASSARSVAPTNVRPNVSSTYSTPVPTPTAVAVENPNTLNTTIIQSIEMKLQTEIEKIINNFITKTASLCSGYKDIKSSLLLTKKAMCDEEGLIKAILQELSELEIEQQKLAEAEEFDKADSLTAKVDALRLKMQNQMNNLNDFKVTYSRLEGQLVQNKDDQCNSVNELRRSLVQGSKREEDEVLKIITENSLKCKKEHNRLQIEEDRINLELRLVEREEDTLNEESKTTNDAIQAQSGDAHYLKVEIDDKLKVLAVEIEELEAKLLTKRAEERKFKLELASVEAKIGDVNRKYERQLQRISDRKQDIIKNKAECMKEAEALLLEKTSHQNESKIVDNLSELIKEWCDSIANTVEVTNILDQIMHHNAAADCSSSSNAGENGNFHELFQSFRAADDHFTKCVSEQRNLVNKLTELTNEMHDIDDKLPKFENEKKAHAAAKRFKEAAKTASDIKEFGSRREVVVSEMNAISEKLPALEETVSAALTQKEEAQQVLKEAQKLEDIRKFKGMLQRMDILRSTKKKMDTLNESNDTAIDKVVQACSVMIDTELDDVYLEAQEIKREYNLQESLECTEEICEEVAVSASVAVPVAVQEETSDVPISPSDPIAEEAVVDDSTNNNAIRTMSEEETGTMLVKASMLMLEYEELTAALQTASDNEDYELAAEIDEKIRNDIKVNLSTCMILLGVQSEEELKQLIEQRQ